MLTDPRAMVDGLEAVWDSTLTAVRDLPEGTFDKATGCPGWSVKDQVAHMIWGQRMLRGEAPVEVDLPDGLAHAQSPLGQYMEWTVQSFRSTPAAEVVEEMAKNAEATVGHLRDMSDDELAAEAPGPMSAPLPRPKFLSIQLFDQWVHEQDIRRAIARPGHLEGPVAEHARDRIAVGLGHVLPKAVAFTDAPVVAFEIVGPIGRRFTLDLSQRPAPPTAEPAREPQVAFSVPFDAFVALGCGRTVPHAQGKGRVRVEGDPLLADQILDHLTVTP